MHYYRLINFYYWVCNNSNHRFGRTYYPEIHRRICDGMRCLGLLCSLLEHIWPESCAQKAWGLKTVGNKGTPLSIKRANIRLVFSIAFNLTLVGPLMLLINKDNQLPQDKLFDSRVIRTERNYLTCQAIIVSHDSPQTRRRQIELKR